MKSVIRISRRLVLAGAGVALAQLTMLTGLARAKKPPKDRTVRGTGAYNSFPSANNPHFRPKGEPLTQPRPTPPPHNGPGQDQQGQNGQGQNQQ